MPLPTAQKTAEILSGGRQAPRQLPAEVRYVFGYAIFLAQMGAKHPDAKPLKGFGGAGVLEVVENFDGDAYRAVYTVKFAGVVYVLDAFQKKAKKGRATPKVDMERIRARLKLAEQHYREHYRAKEPG